MKNKFTKSDIKSGYVVELRDGSLMIAMRCKQESFNKILIKKRMEDWMFFDCFNSDLTFNGYSEYDIMKVYGLNQYPYQALNISSTDRPLLWERKKPVEMTMDEICKALGKQVKIVDKHQFKVGDRVRFKTWEQMEKEFGLDENGDIRTIARFSKLRKHLCGTFATIDSLTGSYVGLRVFSAQEEDHYLCTLDMIEPSPYFHGKVVCVKSNENALTVGKIYEVNDGRIKVGENCYFPTFLSEPIKTLSELNVHRSLQFVEVKDE